MGRLGWALEGESCFQGCPPFGDWSVILVEQKFTPAPKKRKRWGGGGGYGIFVTLRKELFNDVWVMGRVGGGQQKPATQNGQAFLAHLPCHTPGMAHPKVQTGHKVNVPLPVLVVAITGLMYPATSLPPIASSCPLLQRVLLII